MLAWIARLPLDQVRALHRLINVHVFGGVFATGIIMMPARIKNKRGRLPLFPSLTRFSAHPCSRERKPIGNEESRVRGDSLNTEAYDPPANPSLCQPQPISMLLHCTPHIQYPIRVFVRPCTYPMAEEANLQNEEARVRVDSLNTEAHNLQLRETMRRSEEELNSKDRLIEKYQTEIRQRGDEIEKKVGRLLNDA